MATQHDEAELKISLKILGKKAVKERIRSCLRAWRWALFRSRKRTRRRGDTKIKKTPQR